MSYTYGLGSSAGILPPTLADRGRSANPSSGSFWPWFASSPLTLPGHETAQGDQLLDAGREGPGRALQSPPLPLLGPQHPPGHLPQKPALPLHPQLPRNPLRLRLEPQELLPAPPPALFPEPPPQFLPPQALP